MEKPAVTGSGLQFDGLRWRLALDLVFAAEKAKEGVGASEETGFAVEAAQVGRIRD